MTASRIHTIEDNGARIDVWRDENNLIAFRQRSSLNIVVVRLPMDSALLVAETISKLVEEGEE